MNALETPLVILGIDPGSNATGYGLIEMSRQRLRAVDRGVIRPRRGRLGPRLRAIYAGVASLIERYGPDEVAIERAFVHINAASALALGQARGAALAAAMSEPCEYAEYAPRAVKLALVGSGKADKGQVAHMVRHVLRLTGPIAEDASDALAIAVCHAHSRTLGSRLTVRR